MEGIALHSGAAVQLRLEPAPADTGIVWIRSDRPGSQPIPASPEHLMPAERCTALGRSGVRIQTVEHVMAALSGMGVDQCRIVVDGPEPPAGDGSALPFVEMILEAGVVELPAPKRVRRIAAPVWAEEGAARIIALPADELRIRAVLVNESGHPALQDQYGDFVIDPECFRGEIAPARTWGFLSEVKALKARGLIRGAGVENALVLDETGYVSERRFENEPLRHKVLDIVGDLGLLGPLAAEIIAIRPSHRLNTRLAARIAEQASGPEWAGTAEAGK